MLLDNPQVQSSLDVYSAFYAVCSLYLAQHVDSVTVQESCSFLLRCASSDIDKKDAVIQSRLRVLYALCTERRVEFQKYWTTQLTERQRCSLLSACLTNSKEYNWMQIKTILDTLAKCLLLDENRSVFWRSLSSRLFSFLRFLSSSTLLNSKQATRTRVYFQGALHSVLCLLCLVQNAQYSLEWNEWEVAHITAHLNHDNAFQTLCDALTEDYQCAMEDVVKEICASEMSDEAVSRFRMLLTLWSFLISLRGHVRGEECKQVEKALDRITIHSEEGTRAWCTLLSLHAENHEVFEKEYHPLSQRFESFVRDSFSPELVLLFPPPYDELFRFDLYQSIQNSDSLLQLLPSLPLSFMNQLPALLCQMPYRSSLHKLAARLLLRPLPDGTALAIVKALFSYPDDRGEALLLLFELSSKHETLRVFLSRNVDAFWNSPFQQSNKPSLQRAMLSFIRQFYSELPRKKCMYLLLFLESNLLYQSNAEMFPLALATLRELTTCSGNLDLIQSFTLSFVKRERAKENANFVALFELMEGLVVSLPQLIPFLVALLLCGVKREVPPQWIAASALSVGSVCLYDMNCSFSQPLHSICRDSTALKVLQASFVSQVFCQVLLTLHRSRVEPEGSPIAASFRVVVILFRAAIATLILLRTSHIIPSPLLPILATPRLCSRESALAPLPPAVSLRTHSFPEGKSGRFRLPRFSATSTKGVLQRIAFSSALL